MGKTLGEVFGMAPGGETNPFSVFFAICFMIGVLAFVIARLNEIFSNGNGNGNGSGADVKPDGEVVDDAPPARR